jgi:2-keto-4-pentenoate hydratase/2-oxohepta-3-ene-1,7-dioic acid hydratase in catechol pathway
VPAGRHHWLPPCRPGKIIGLWNNFRAAAAKNGWAVPAEPLYFLKSPSAAPPRMASHPGARPYDGRVAYEGELVVVIGRRGTAGRADAGRGHIFWATPAANDVTAIELLHRDPASRSGHAPRASTALPPSGPVIDTDFDPSRHAAHPGGRPRAPELPAGRHVLQPARTGLAAVAGHDA